MQKARLIAQRGNKSSTALRRFSNSDSEPSLFGVVSTSQIVPDGPNLLLFRETSGPVFSISPSGEVRARKLKVDGNYRLFTIRSDGDSWTVELTREIPGEKGEVLSIYAFDSDSDTPRREYVFPKDFGWGLACTDGSEFTFITANTEKKNLSLVKLAPMMK